MSAQRPPFEPFDPERAVRVYRRSLPHWRQKGATYFVTFHLQDSIPEEAVQRIEHEKAHWLTARGIDPNTPDVNLGQLLSPHDHFEFQRHINRLREGIADAGYGSCVLRERQTLILVKEELLREDGNGWHMGDFIIMPNHVHLLIVPAAHELEQCLKRIKARSALACNRQLERTGSLWQADSFDHIVRTLEHLEKYRTYIADNPKQARITVHPEAHYKL